MKFNFRYLGAAILVLALLIPTFAVSAKTLKFTFSNVTFSDGTQGVIEAGTKQVGNSSTYTVCDFYTSGYTTYLGQYQDANFFSSDATAIKQFCLDHFVDRTLP